MSKNSLIFILGTQRSFSSIAIQLLESHGVNIRIPTPADPTGFVIPPCNELHSLVVVNRLLHRQFFGFHENAIPYRRASNHILGQTQSGYPKLDGEYHPALVKYGNDILAECAGQTSAVKDPVMILCWDFWKRLIDAQKNRHHYIFGMTVRNPYEIALSCIVRSCVGFRHLSDVYGLIEAQYRCQLAVIDEYRHREGFSILPIRACREHHRADTKRLLTAAGILFCEEIYAEHFQSKETHDTGIEREHSVFAAYRQLLEVCETL